MPMEISHIWLERFSSEGDVKAYFEEHYNDGNQNDEDGQIPISQFAADQGEWFYDHNWIELGFEENHDLRALVARHSYSSDYLEEVL
jgi:Immunity protein 22